MPNPEGGDLLPAFVGETEQNIARAFAEAGAVGAVPVIDAVASFLQNRASAVRSWEVPQTNEFLIALEVGRGSASAPPTCARTWIRRPCGPPVLTSNFAIPGPHG